MHSVPTFSCRCKMWSRLQSSVWPRSVDLRWRVLKISFVDLRHRRLVKCRSCFGPVDSRSHETAIWWNWDIFNDMKCLNKSIDTKTFTLWILE
jgi:hypothetical protein